MKKITYYPKLLISAVMVLLVVSCSDFINVQPAGQVDEDEQFSSIRGFRNTMYGAYGSMATSDLYGGNLGFGFVDQLGQMFGYDNSSETSYFVGQYDYMRSDVRSIVDAIWAKQYQVIAYVNNIIYQTENAKFEHAELPLMRGECYGLRAFMHFDLVRLFAEDYGQSNASTRGIPYSTSFDLNNKKLLTLHKTYEAILSDLDKAEELLKNDDVVNVETTASSDYLKGRAVFFNKYAVAATKARVYYAMGDEANAAKYAKQVIDATNNFSLKKYSSLSTFTEGRRDLENLYETSAFSATSTDLRYTGYYRQNTTPDGLKTYSFVRFLESDAQVNSNPLQGLILIRLPEMYYILSECTYDSNKTEAVRLLNEVRKSRGLEDVDSAKVATREAFNKEMLRERMREMPGEGQTFYALKHYNKPFTDFRGITTRQPSNSIFVLPWPETEKEFGGQ